MDAKYLTHSRLHRLFTAATICSAVAIAFLAAKCATAQPAEGASYRLPHADPANVQMSAERLAGIQALVEAGIAEGKMPGCVVCVGRHGKIAYLEAFGRRKLPPEEETMTTDTVFDMASITKPVATATSIMKLVEDGRLRLEDKVVTIFPEFAPNGKDSITIKHMLIHQSGLIPDNSLKDYLDGPELAWKRICDLGLVAEVGTTFKYSDVNFIVLAKIVEKITGQNVHEFSQTQTFQPLGMNDTGYVPNESLRKRAATTEKRKGRWMRGEVHDPRAYELDGIAGHAGLFSTAEDLALYAQMMLGQGTLETPEGDVKIMSPQTMRTMTSSYPVSTGQRGLGWDKQTRFSSNRGDLLSHEAFGHGGFTGTVLWVDPQLDLFFIFLSNRVHPNGKGSVNYLAGRILNRIVSSIHDAPKAPVAVVKPGIDMLREDGFKTLEGQRVGLITNHTGLDSDGTSTARILADAKNVQLTALFSPEHGFAGQLDTAKIDDATDTETGLKVYSLYGETRRPTPEMLEQVDTLVFDIQDIGARFYTYISTMGEAMQAAGKAGKRFVVLDRPNPLGGVKVSGPMLDAGLESFVGFHRLPVQHGMTTGEIAKLLHDQLHLTLDLQIVKCQGWRRDLAWESTNLTWVNPSPNMRSLTQAFLYPGIGLLETTNVSVGRGTDTPFEVLGAPWIDGRELALHLSARNIPGVKFVPIRFTPEASKFANEACGGINISLTDRDALHCVRVGLEIAAALRQLYPDDWETKSFNRLLSNKSVFESVVAGESIAETLEKAQEDIAGFMRDRGQYLLY
ncbi:MAG: hypothetical protein Aurels2KO_53060 [Aureliella sp.]